MKFSDICIITENVSRLARFYETVFQTKAEGDDIHRWDGVDSDRRLSAWVDSKLTRPHPHMPENFGALVFVKQPPGERACATRQDFRP